MGYVLSTRGALLPFRQKIQYQNTLKLLLLYNSLDTDQQYVSRTLHPSTFPICFKILWNLPMESPKTKLQALLPSKLVLIWTGSDDRSRSAIGFPVCLREVLPKPLKLFPDNVR